jgi:YcxB-like protein
MSSNFQLEYNCSKAEIKEAESLNQHYKMGGGPKWRSGLLIYLAFGGIILVAYYRVRYEFSPEEQWLCIPVAVVVFITLRIIKRQNSKNATKSTRMEVSEQGLTTIAGDKRALTRWSGFGKCLESPNLFVLLDLSERLLVVLPRRAFPDAASQDWFRVLANQRPTKSELPSEETASSDKALPPDGIVLNFQLGYRDYLSRMISSWRTKGIVLLIFSMVTVICIVQGMHPDPNAVNPPVKVYFVYMLPTLCVMLPVVFLIVTLVTWLSEKELIQQQNLILTDAGIIFSELHASGSLGWDTFDYYLENPWSYIIWKGGARTWFLWALLGRRCFTVNYS